MERGCVSCLRIMAWIYLLASLAGGALIVWGTNYGFGLAIGLLIQGMAACALMFCIAAIAEDTGIMTADKRAAIVPGEGPGVVGISFGDPESNLITFVTPGSPADKAGITAGYRLMSVNLEPTKSGTQAHRMLGGEVGTAVTCSVLKDRIETNHSLIRVDRGIIPGYEV